MSRETTDAFIDQAEAAIRAGSTLKDASDAIGFNPDYVSKLLRARGVTIKRGGKPAPNRRTDLPEGNIVSDYAGGMSELALSRKHGCARMVITKILLRNNVERRNGSEANKIRFSRASAEERASIVSKARAKRFDNMIAAASDVSINNPAVGIGEREIADALEHFGLPVTRQKVIGPYLVDMAIGDIAVEVKQVTGAHGVQTERRERLEYLFERGVSVLTIFVENEIAVRDALDKIVAFIERFCGNPPSVAEHWMVRCRLYDPSVKLKDNYWSEVITTPNTVTAIRKINGS